MGGIDMKMGLGRVVPEIPLGVIVKNIVPFLNPLTYHSLRIACKETFDAIPAIRPSDFMHNAKAALFQNNLTTVLAFEYACNKICPCCRKRYANGTFDRSTGVYVHNLCAKSLWRIFRYEPESGYIDEGEYCTAHLKYSIVPNTICIVGQLNNGGLLVPSRIQTLSMLMNDRAAENQAILSHQRFFRILTSRERIGKLFFENAYVKFNLGSSFRRIDIGELCVKEIDAILGNLNESDADVEKKVTEFVENMKGWVGNISRLIYDRYKNEVLPFVYKPGDVFTNWEGFWYHGLCVPLHKHNAQRCSGTEYWRMLLHTYETESGSFDVNELIKNMLSSTSYVNEVNFVSNEIDRHQRRTVLECCECYRCSILHTSLTFRHCRLHVQSSDELSNMLKDPNSSSSQMIISNYEHAIDQVYDTVALYLSFDKYYSYPRPSIALFRMHFRELLGSLVLPRCYPFDYCQLRKNCQALVTLMEHYSLTDLYNALISMRSKSGEYFLNPNDSTKLRVYAARMSNSRCTCVCGTRIVSTCDLNLCNVCCVSNECRGHRKLIAFLNSNNDESSMVQSTGAVSIYSDSDSEEIMSD